MGDLERIYGLHAVKAVLTRDPARVVQLTLADRRDDRRIAEIEANPGLVNFEQLMKLLSVLGVSLTLREVPVAPAATGAPAAKAPRRAFAAHAWVEYAGAPVGDAASAHFSPILSSFPPMEGRTH